MEVHNALDPNEAQLRQFSENTDEGPIFMVNLLKFRDRAEYEDGRETSMTGQEAYAIYGAAVAETLADVGGEIVFFGEVSYLQIGEVEDLWDQVAIARYPNRAAMAEMVMSEKYQAIHVHRAAGLAGQLNIETRGMVSPAGG